MTEGSFEILRYSHINTPVTQTVKQLNCEKVKQRIYHKVFLVVILLILHTQKFKKRQ